MHSEAAQSLQSLGSLRSVPGGLLHARAMRGLRLEASPDGAPKPLLEEGKILGCEDKQWPVLVIPASSQYGMGWCNPIAVPLADQSVLLAPGKGPFNVCCSMGCLAQASGGGVQAGRAPPQPPLYPRSYLVPIQLVAPVRAAWGQLRLGLAHRLVQ